MVRECHNIQYAWHLNVRGCLRAMEARKDDVDVGGAAGAGARAVGLMLPNNKPAKATEREWNGASRPGLHLKSAAFSE